MIEITASLVKELRRLTGIGIMDCKKALIQTNGNIELAVENMRRSNAIKKAKNICNNTASNGISTVRIEGNYGIILEVNCQTDFVAKSIEFQTFVNKVLDVAFSDKINKIKALRSRFEEERIMLVNKIGENINISRVADLEGETLGSYQHGTRISVLVAAKNANENLIKKLAMHIAASNPSFIKSEEVSNEIIERERLIQLDIAMQYNKPKEIIENIVEGRMKRFINEISLNNQPFIMDLSKTVSQILKEHNADIINFIRFEVGGNIKKINKNITTETVA